MPSTYPLEDPVPTCPGTAPEWGLSPLPLLPEVPLLPESPVPVPVPPPEVPLLPLVPIEPLPEVPVPPPVLPLVALPEEPDVVPELLLPLLVLEEPLCFFCFFLLECLVVSVCWSPDADEPVACELPDWPAVLLDCACAFTETAIAAATEAPSRPFNSLCIFMSIS